MEKIPEHVRSRFVDTSSVDISGPTVLAQCVMAHFENVSISMIDMGGPMRIHARVPYDPWTDEPIALAHQLKPAHVPPGHHSTSMGRADLIYSSECVL